MAQPRTWAVVPVKRLADAKSRLAGVMGPAERQAFCLAMLDDVLAALGHAHGLAGTLAVTADGEAAARARAAGAGVVEEAPVAGLNAALDLAVAALASERADRLLVLPADVPLVTPDSLAPLLAAGDGVTLVPDRAKVGTNGLLMAPVGALPFRFGPSSLARHREEAQTRGIQCHVLASPELALDIDTPDDLNALMALRAARRRA